ncbi:hypothetical protein ACFSR6_20690 [Pedobacter vanadiisoli]|uniref:Uncharacterized protein n=1 Tax=Pedobacter vanadiisoli TaxID=1761975 RepID=A0ABW5MP60_9SPHI
MKKSHSQYGKVKFFFFYTFLTCLCINCKTIDGDGANDQVDQCINIKGKRPKGCPILPTIGKVRLYLETSASMNGYFGGNTEYKQIVTDLAVKIDKEISPTSINFISDTIRSFPNNATAFSSHIATTKLAIDKSSQLHEIFKKIALNTKGEDVSIFISDCILSFPNKVVKANPSINKTSASSTLKNNIYSTFIDLKNNKQAASLYAFSSQFFGTYYDYQNVKTKLPGTVRPFYIWVIAKNNILPVFDEKLIRITDFKPEQSLHFGLIDNMVNQYHILTQLGMVGEWALIKSDNKQSDVGIENVKTAKNNPQEFYAAVDLSTLPPYAQKPEYIAKNLKLNQKGCTAAVTVSVKGSADRLKSNKQKTFFAQATHIIKVTIKNIQLENASLQITLPLQYDTWYQNWSTMDDKQVKTLGKKTFAFQYLVNGIMEAYNNTDKNFIDLKFQINQ